MLEKKDRVAGYSSSPVASVGALKNLTPGVNLIVDSISESVDDHEDWGFDDAIGGYSAQRVGFERNLQDLQDECRTKKRRVPPNVAETV